MSTNKFLKLLCSLPVILLFLYFIPFLGICLILVRPFVYNNKKVSAPVILIITALVLLIPKLVNIILDIANVKINKIPYLYTILNSKFYNNDILAFSKYLIISGVILIIVSFVLKSLIEKVKNKLNNSVNKYMDKTIEAETKIKKENDLEIKIRKDNANNTSYVKCPKCGSDNIVTGKFGTCKYCRSSLENKKYE